MRILVSAGEASGDLYASRVVEALRARHPDAEFFGCAGPRTQAAGVRAVVDQRSLAVVGIVEVLSHIPRIYGEFRKLIRAAEREKPDLAILTDSPDFHLRVAKKLRARGIPVVYLIAPQVWAWRRHRTRAMRRDLRELLCIFPFEKPFFEKHGVPVEFIGHPLARIVKPSMTRAEFCARFGIPESSRIVLLLAGSRHGEVRRHLPYLVDAVKLICKQHPNLEFILALPPGFGPVSHVTGPQLGANFSERNSAEAIQHVSGSGGAGIRVIEGHTWDSMAAAEVALAASGTVTVEAMLLGLPMVTFYRVNELSWILGRWMVKAPFLSMVNLVAGRKIVAELIQDDMTPESLAAEASRLLGDTEAQARMRADLAEAANTLRSEHDPMEMAAAYIDRVLENETVHAG
ncbi:MAG: lipid-A-disaccharide synthase [Bryobacteraceae bacterium]